MTVRDSALFAKGDSDIDTGLHLTPEAYRLFYKETLKVIADKWPDETPDRLSYAPHAWGDTAAWAKEDSQSDHLTLFFTRTIQRFD